jgi:hypothetical protein
VPTYHYYKLETGEFLGRSFTASSEEVCRRNTPAGCGAFLSDGRIDRRLKRLDLETGKLIDQRPPAPSADHEWHEPTSHWRLKPEVKRARLRVQRARRLISESEAASLRVLREALLEILPADSPARARLLRTDEEIAAHRLTLRP